MGYVGAEEKKITWKSGKWMRIKPSTTLQLIRSTNHLGQLSVYPRHVPAAAQGTVKCLEYHDIFPQLCQQRIFSSHQVPVN